MERRIAMLKLCKDCAFYERNWCLRDPDTRISPIDGRLYHVNRNPHYERSKRGPCGPNAIHFVQRASQHDEQPPHRGVR